MKKLAIPVIVLLLVSLLVACGGNGGGNEYTGDFNEYNSSSSSAPSEQVGTSSGDSNSDIVVVPLTTQQGATVPEVTTTQPVSELPTVDYTPIVPDVTKPTPNTTYYNDPTETTTNLSNLLGTGESSSDTTEDKTTSSELKYYSIEYGDAVPVNDPSNDKVVIVRVACASMTGDPISSSGTAVVNNATTGKQFNAKYKVSNKRVEDDDFEVKVTVGDTNVSPEDTITIVLPKGAIKTTDNKANKKCVSLQYTM